MKRFWQNNQVYVSCILVVWLLNVILFLALSKNGLGLSIDSVNYFSAAYNLWFNKSLILFDGLPLVNAVPLYSYMLLSAFFLGIDLEVYALVLQLFFFNAQLFFLFLILRNLGVNKNSIWIYLALLLGNYFAFVQVYVWALTEMGFMALLSAWVYLLVFRPNQLIGSAILFGLLCLQRYVIWFFLPGLVLYWMMQKKSVLYMLKQLWFGVLLSAIWLYRNYLVQGNFAGNHSFAQKFGAVSFVENVQVVFSGIIGLNPLYAGIAYYLIALVFLGLTWQKGEGKAKEFTGLLFLLGLSLLVGLLAQQNLQMSQLPRYISVFYVLVGFGFWLFLEQMSVHIWLKRTVLMAILGVSLFLLINKVLYFRQVGLGIQASLAYWVEIENVALNKYPDLPMLSNFPDVVWLKTGKTCGYLPFLNEDYNSFSKRTPAGFYKVIWFKDSSREMLMNDAVLNENADFTPMYNGHWHKIGTLKIGSGY
ncbi:MAG: hypothetical protein Q8R57_07325 [Bacteroidota bacterium]|nr:hypothetical protein [Bacteroidota bacterium]